MSARPDCPRSSFARSLSAIHIRPEGAISPNPSLESGGAGIVESKKRDRGGKAIHGSKDGGRSRNPRSVSPTTSLHALPFCKGGSKEDCSPPSSRESSRERPVKKLPRRPSVTFAPCTKPAPSVTAQEERGSRQGYLLGEAVRCPSHMAVESTPEDAARAVDALQKHDYAFVRRSDGSYSYAILAYRSFEQSRGELMTFVVRDDGSTKTIRRKHWGELVRLVSGPEADNASAPTTHSDERPEECAPINILSFVPVVVEDDECSLISSVSDRAHRR